MSGDAQHRLCGILSRLIRGRGLREQVVSFFHAAGANRDFINRNHITFVDDIYVTGVLASGMVLARTAGAGCSAAVLEQGEPHAGGVELGPGLQWRSFREAGSVGGEPPLGDRVANHLRAGTDSQLRCDP